ncbi:MAG: aminoglycoside adenylyltransferase domain-containing protein, partial [Planctomycetota bacterium]
FELTAMTRADAQEVESPRFRWAIEAYAEHQWRVQRSETPEEDLTLITARETCRRSGYALAGPEARAVFAEAPARALLRSAEAELAWWVEQDPLPQLRTPVLNACRAWRLADEGGLASKLEGGAWARLRIDRPAWLDIVDRAAEGGPARPGDAATAREFLQSVLYVLDRRLRGQA